ncbi:MAG: hypothetical protein FJX03_06075 [Alphaproteobacteria bacterium]|nr:hypothetical protein [Alphaproteobacteria bacterium]
MHYLLIRAMVFISLVSTNYAYGTQENPNSSNLEMRNGYTSPATFRIFPNIPGIDEGPLAPMDTICITLEAAKDGVQTRQIHSFPKRYGLVNIEIAGGNKFYGVVDLRSLITIGSSGTVFSDLNLPPSAMNDSLPEWLYRSMSFKRFSLADYVRTLKNNWASLSEDDKKNPGMMRILDMPSCLHGINLEPEISTPFPHCLNSQIKSVALQKYKNSHPEVSISEDEIKKAEQDLKKAGLPIYIHD